MKIPDCIRALACLAIFMLCFENSSFSQCPNGKTANTISYDSIFPGSGNTAFDLNFPQFDTSKIYLHFPEFDPSKGTLVSVDFTSIITVKNKYKLENDDAAPSFSRVMVVRTDTLNFTSIPSLSNEMSKQIASNVLAPSDGVTGSGTDYKAGGPIYSYNKFKIQHSIDNNLASFMGNGQVFINYKTSTDLYATGSNNVFTSTTEDSIYFQITYHYCLTSLLPAEINNFNATKISSGRVLLYWNTPNELPGNIYEVQKSIDGINYHAFQTINAKPGAANDYKVTYSSGSDDKDRLFFRIKQTEADGSIKYSGIKTVALEYSATTMKLYPTVTKDIVNIYFPYSGKSDYKVSIVSLTGQVMQQSAYARTNFIKVNLKAGFKPGLYIISVVNKQTAETQQSKLIIQ